MDAVAQPENKNQILAGLSYLFLLLGIIGVFIDVAIYYTTKNKYAKFHAGQASWLMITFLILGLILVVPSFLALQTEIASVSVIGYVFNLVKISIIFFASAAAFAGKDFRIPIAAQILEK